jgi:glycosyltransferase involved in cell wall biosynthesis
MRPVFIPDNIREYWNTPASSESVCHKIASLYAVLTGPAPEISIVIPAFNEEANIVKTLLSLCSNRTPKKIEIIVVNNNSSDNTSSLVRSCGVVCIDELRQGITQARNTGLANARGKFILNADADTLYPENWIQEMIAPLDRNENVALTYGRFSFIPVGNTRRGTYFFYEYATDLVRWINTQFREEAVNVYGFNSGFRREQGLEVDGFNHPPGTNEDGWLGLKLREKGFGKLYHVTNAPVWTTDRRIQIDGGLWKAVWKRIKRNIS